MNRILFVLILMVATLGCVNLATQLRDATDGQVNPVALTVGYFGADTGEKGSISRDGHHHRVERVKSDGSIHGANVSLTFSLEPAEK